MALLDIGPVPATADRIQVTFAQLVGSQLFVTAAATQDNWQPTLHMSMLTQLIITPAAGGTTISGIISGGFTIASTALVIVNASTTDNITFLHQSTLSTPTARFNCPTGVSVLLQPYAATTVAFIGTCWQFS